MFRREVALVVEESPQVVWAFVSNLPVSLTCHRARRSFQWRNDSKAQLGSRYGLEQSLLGITYRQEGRVTRWEPPHGFALAHWSPRRPRWGFSHQQRFGVHAVEGRPRAAELRCTVIGGLGPWYVELPLKWFVRRSMLDHLQALKRAIESTEKDGSARRDQPARLAQLPAASLG